MAVERRTRHAQTLADGPQRDAVDSLFPESSARSRREARGAGRRGGRRRPAFRLAGADGGMTRSVKSSVDNVNISRLSYVDYDNITSPLHDRRAAHRHRRLLMVAALDPGPGGPLARPSRHHRRAGVAQAGEVRGVDCDLHADPGVDVHVSPRLGPNAPHRRLGDRRHSDRRGRRSSTSRPGAAPRAISTSARRSMPRCLPRWEWHRDADCSPASRWRSRSGGSGSPMPRSAGRCASG